MSSKITLPAWLYVVVISLAVLAVVQFLLLPGFRWLLARRTSKVIADVNTTLRVTLPARQPGSRDVLIDQLTHDHEIMKVVESEAARRGVPRSELMADVTHYAQEMVPAFNAYFYFRIGYWMARGLLRTLYEVRKGFTHEAALAPVASDTAVVLFINHRSNMDYLLVTYLASRSAALSYGAGEWCRVWPFKSVLRLAGAYIIRRNAGEPLYRKVLERYVQIATKSRVAHAIFGQGHLSRDGKVNNPKLGLLGYITKTFDSDGDLDVLFVPVAVNFDCVIEERTLVTNAQADFRGRGAVFVLASTSGFVLKQIWRKLTGNWPGFGSACANFGEPVSLKAWSKRHRINFCNLDRDRLFEAVEQLGSDLTRRIVAIMPVLPVPAIAMVLLNAGEPVESAELVQRTCALMDNLRRAGAHIAIEAGTEDAAIEDALVLLTQRGVISKQNGQLVMVDPDQRPLLEYYANSVRQLTSQIATQDSLR